MTRKGDWEGRAARGFCIALGVLTGYLALRYASSVLLVLLIAWLIASAVYPLSCRTSRALHLPQRLCAVLYVLLLLGLLFGAIVLLARHIGEEAQELLARMEQEEGGIVGSLERTWDACLARLSRLPLIGTLADWLREPSSEHAVGNVLSGLLQEALSNLGAMGSEALGRILRATPRFFIRTVICVMATFYLAADYGPLTKGFLSLFSPSTRTQIERLHRGAGRAVRRYLRAYLLLFSLTFAEVLVGLWILKQPYAFLLALLVAFVDLLPIFGAGAVLVPWAIFSLLFGAHSLGLGLLILYGVMSIVRQIAEPHLLGGSLGLPPFVMLAFMFVGWELFGIFGLLISPFVALLAKELLFGKKREEREDS